MRKEAPCNNNLSGLNPQAQASGNLCGTGMPVEFVSSGRTDSQFPDIIQEYKFASV
jgi:hypothetical protein